MGTGTSLVVQWLRLCASTAGGMGSISGKGTKILHVCTARPKKEKQKTNKQTKNKWEQNRPNDVLLELRARNLSIKQGRLPGGGDAFEVSFKEKLEDNQRLATK